MRKPRPQDVDPKYEKLVGPKPEKVDMTGVVAIKPKPKKESYTKSISEKPERVERPERSDVPERHVRVQSKKREIRRHSFEIYRDQVLKLSQLKTEHMMTGEMKSMSSMVREAIDNYFESIKNRSDRTPRTERT